MKDLVGIARQGNWGARAWSLFMPSAYEVNSVSDLANNLDEMKPNSRWSITGFLLGRGALVKLPSCSYQLGASLSGPDSISDGMRVLPVEPDPYSSSTMASLSLLRGVEIVVNPRKDPSCKVLRYGCSVS